MDNSNNNTNNNTLDHHINLQVGVIDEVGVIDDFNSINIISENAIDFISNLLQTRLLSNELVEDSYESSILTRSFEEDMKKFKHVISDTGESSIKYIPYTSNAFKTQKKCVITMTSFEESQIIAKLPCNHIFKKEAILKWLKEENATCPICRFKFDSKEEKIIEKKNTSSNETIPIIQTVLNMINHITSEQEEEDIQQAILASLQDTSENN